jgi:signal transduction histidine kinase
MRERAELIGGALELLRPRDGGTLVRLTVPLSA